MVHTLVSEKSEKAQSIAGEKMAEVIYRYPVFVFLIIVSCYFKVQYDMAYNSSSECADFLCREYLYKFFASFIPRAPISGFLIWLIADKLYQIVIFRQRREKDEKL